MHRRRRDAPPTKPSKTPIKLGHYFRRQSARKTARWHYVSAYHPPGVTLSLCGMVSVTDADALIKIEHKEGKVDLCANCVSMRVGKKRPNVQHNNHHFAHKKPELHSLIDEWMELAGYAPSVISHRSRITYNFIKDIIPKKLHPEICKLAAARNAQLQDKSRG